MDEDPKPEKSMSPKADETKEDNGANRSSRRSSGLLDSLKTKLMSEKLLRRSSMLGDKEKVNAKFARSHTFHASETPNEDNKNLRKLFMNEFSLRNVEEKPYFAGIEVTLKKKRSAKKWGRAHSTDFFPDQKPPQSEAEVTDKPKRPKYHKQTSLLTMLDGAPDIVPRPDVALVQNDSHNITNVFDRYGSVKRLDTSGLKDDPEDVLSLADDVAVGIPNHPHESLEFPPLYFFLKTFPVFLACVDFMYRLRWNILYPLQQRLPFSKKLIKIGVITTWAEFLLIAPLFALLVAGIVTSFYNPSVSNTGQIARLPLIFCYLTAAHNNFLTLWTGMPFERAIRYHKYCGRLAFLIGIFHTYVCFAHPDHQMVEVETESLTHADKDNIFRSVGDITMVMRPPNHSNEGSNPSFFRFIVGDQYCISGTLIFCLIFSMIATSLRPIRKACFEFFYYLHVIFAVAMSACAFYHSGIAVPILVGLLWGGDLVTRKIYMAFVKYPRTAAIKVFADSVTEISFPKTKDFSYNPGQYVFIAVPELSIFQWHPFSISSSPHQDMVTLHIRAAGTWTQSLHDLAQKRNNGEVQLCIEGPFGSVGVDLFSERYKMIMLLSAGIGVTPMQSICNQLMYQNEEEGRDLKKMWFIWTSREPEVVESMSKSMHKSVTASKSASTSGSKSVTAPGPNLDDVNKRHLEEGINAVDKGVDNSLNNNETETEDAKEFQDNPLNSNDNSNAVTFSNRNPEQFGEDKLSKFDDSIPDEFIDDEEEELLKFDFYLTGKNKDKNYDENLPIQQCRPDLTGLFENMRKAAIEAGETRIAVCVCANDIVTGICRNACVEFSDSDVYFDFHSEVFE